MHPLRTPPSAVKSRSSSKNASWNKPEALNACYNNWSCSKRGPTATSTTCSKQPPSRPVYTEEPMLPTKPSSSPMRPPYQVDKIQRTSKSSIYESYLHSTSGIRRARHQTTIDLSITQLCFPSKTTETLKKSLTHECGVQSDLGKRHQNILGHQNDFTVFVLGVHMALWHCCNMTTLLRGQMLHMPSITTILRVRTWQIRRTAVLPRILVFLIPSLNFNLDLQLLSCLVVLENCFDANQV